VQPGARLELCQQQANHAVACKAAKSHMEVKYAEVKLADGFTDRGCRCCCFCHVVTAAGAVTVWNTRATFPYAPSSDLVVMVSIMAVQQQKQQQLYWVRQPQAAAGTATFQAAEAAAALTNNLLLSNMCPAAVTVA
jgi:hypothetical protein